MYQALGGELISFELAFELEDAVVVMLEVVFAGDYDFHIIKLITPSGGRQFSAFLYRLLIRKIMLFLAFPLRFRQEVSPN